MKEAPSPRWSAVVDEACRLADLHRWPVTLEQLAWQLERRGFLPPGRKYRQALSRELVPARAAEALYVADGRHPFGRRAPSWTSPVHATRWLAESYRRDITEGQERTVYLAIDSAPLVEVIDYWVGGWGVVVFHVRGNPTLGWVEALVADVGARERPAVLLSVGDLTPHREAAEASLLRRADCFEGYERLAVTPMQAKTWGLPAIRLKRKDPTTAAYQARHGPGVDSYPVAAIDPRVLHDLVLEAVRRHIDLTVMQAVIDRQEAERAELRQALERAMPSKGSLPVVP